MFFNKGGYTLFYAHDGLFTLTEDQTGIGIMHKFVTTGC